MKLWILRPIHPVRARFGGYDMVQGFVISAKTEKKARAIAQSHGGDEVTYEANNDAWANPALSTCRELEPGEEPGVIMRDLNAG